MCRNLDSQPEQSKTRSVDRSRHRQRLEARDSSCDVVRTWHPAEPWVVGEGPVQYVVGEEAARKTCGLEALAMTDVACAGSEAWIAVVAARTSDLDGGVYQILRAVLRAVEEYGGRNRQGHGQWHCSCDGPALQAAHECHRVYRYAFACSQAEIHRQTGVAHESFQPSHSDVGKSA
jgi:hypothetical protein